MMKNMHSAKNANKSLLPKFFLGLIPIFLLAINVNATQLSGTYTIDSSGSASSTNFLDFSSAVTYMTSTNARKDGGPSNSGTVGVSGQVIFNVKAGTTYTLDTALVISAVPGASLSNTIIFRRSGKGANPVITAYTGSRNNKGANTTFGDAMILLNGASFITFDGIDLQDAPGNTTLTTMMEMGYYLQKSSAYDGSQYDTIRGCTVTMKVDNTNYTYGLLSHWQNTDNVQVVAKSFSGTNSYNAFEGNIINNCVEGIFFVATSINDIGNDIGSIKGNTVNMANTAGPNSVNSNSNAILAQNQNGISIQNNTVTGYFGSNTILPYGIFLNGGDSATAAAPLVTVNNNDITLTANSASAALIGISCASVAGSGYRMDITNNRIHLSNPKVTNGYLTGILNAGHNVLDTVNISNNTISNCGLFYGYGSFNGIEDNSSSGLATEYITNNIINNNIRDSGSAGDMFLIHFASSSGADLVESNNAIDSNINNDAGFVVGIFNSGSTNSETINGNTMHDFSNTNTKGTYSYTYGTSVSATGIYASSSTGAREIHQDTIYSLSSLGGFVTGIQITGSSSSMNISRNKIYDLAQTDNPYNSAIYGISAQAGDSVLITNNLIGNLTTTAANNSANGLIGIISQGPSAVWAYYNTIYLNDTTSSRNTAFGCQDFYCNISTALTLNNNIFVNTSTGGGGTSGYATCIAWNKTPISYDASSNNNLFYAGTPGIGTNNYIYYDNTNLLDSLSAYQALVSPSDSMAVTENPPFLSTSGASYYFLHIDPAKKTQIESGAIAISGITDDYDSTGSRPVGGYPLKGQIYGGGTAPDIGADEFDGSIILKSWIGITSTDWNTSSNWYGGKIPGVTDDAFIPASAPHQPLLGSGVAYCNNITIDSLASLGISGGSFFLNGNLTCNGTYNHTGGMMFFAGNKAQNIYSKKSLTFYKLNSYGKGAKTLNEDITIVDSLIISDSLADNGHVITAKGNINNNGAESGKGKILLSTNGSSMHTITGNGIYTNLDLNDSIGAISSGNAIVSNTLNIDKGSLAIWTKTFTANKVNISASGTLNITGGSFYLLGDFNNAGTYSHSGGTMIFSGTSAQQIKSNSALTFFKLNSSGTGIKTLNANSTISDSLVIGSTLEDNGNIITARANINISGIHSSTGSGHILLANGATSHNLSGNGKYDNLTINDTAGAVLYANPVISGVLTLSKGNIRVGIHKLIIAQKGSIASGSSSSYIVTDNTGKLYRAGMDTAAFTFPIGTKSSFAPVIFDDSLNSGDSISMRVQSETSSSSFAPALPTGALTNVNLQWQIDEAMKGGSHAKLSFAWNAADESGTIASPAVIAQSNGTAWTATNASLGTHKASAGGFAAFSSPFAIYTIKLTGIGEMGTEDKTYKVWYNQDIKKLQVLFSESKNLVIKMKIIDALGKVVVEKDINATEGNNEAQFDMNGFARGLYTFIFYSGHEVQTSKFIRY